MLLHMYKLLKGPCCSLWEVCLQGRYAVLYKHVYMYICIDLLHVRYVFYIYICEHMQFDLCMCIHVYIYVYI
jgi:hypothetical protein